MTLIATLMDLIHSPFSLETTITKIRRSNESVVFAAVRKKGLEL